MAVNLSPVGGVAAQFFTNTGAVLTGGKLYTYAAGTTTPQAAYITSAGNVPWTNPIVLDAAGRVPSGGEIWLTDGLIYKFVLKDSNDVLIATYDNITGINSNAIAYTNQQEIVTATAGQTVFNLGISYQPGTNSLSVFVDGVNQYGPGAQYSYVETDGNTVTFNSGLHVGAEVKFTTTQQQGAGVVDASQVTYDPPFTGSIPTNVEAKLAQTVSVKDFGAVGNGVTDDTVAIQAACQACSDAGGGTVYFPAGEYVLTSCLDLGQYNILSQLDATTNQLESIQVHLVGETNTASKIIWKGGTGANGLYGTAVVGRSKYFNSLGVNTGYLDCNSIIKNIGFVGGFDAGYHPGGYPLQTGAYLNFSTLADNRAAVSHPSVTFATYPRDPYVSPLLDTNAVIPDNTASAAIVYRGQSSGYVEGCSFQQFAYGVAVQWGYGFVIRNNDFRYNLVGIRAQYITTMEVHNNTIERCGCGYYTYGAAQLVEVHQNAIQANYAGCDMLFAGYNFQYNVHDNYFEASPNNIILTGDSSGLYRNRAMRFFRNWSVNIRASLFACELLEFEENLIVPAPSGFTNVWNETVDPPDFQLVVVKNNVEVNNVDATKPNYLFTDWTLSPTFLDIRDTLPVNKYNPRPDAETQQAGAIYTRQLRFTTAVLGAFLTITVPNQNTQVALKISEVRGAVGAASQYTTVAEWIVAINRQAGSVAIAQVQNVYNYNLANAGSGADAGNSTVTTAVSGGAGDENGITLRQIGTTVAGTATSVFTVEMTIAVGQAFMTVV